MYSIYLYLYRSSASFLEIQMKKHKRAAFCECCANNIFFFFFFTSNLQTFSASWQTLTAPSYSPQALTKSSFKTSNCYLCHSLTDKKRLQSTLILAGKCTSIQQRKVCLIGLKRLTRGSDNRTWAGLLKLDNFFVPHFKSHCDILTPIWCKTTWPLPRRRKTKRTSMLACITPQTLSSSSSSPALISPASRKWNFTRTADKQPRTVIVFAVKTSCVSQHHATY